MHQIGMAKLRNSILVNENSVEFNRIMGRNFILNNDTHLTFNPVLSDPRELIIQESEMRRNAFERNNRGAANNPTNFIDAITSGR